MTEKFWRPGDNPEGMHIITLWQPWASLILFGWKTIESRKHARFRSLQCIRIGIHAGLEWDRTAMKSIRQYLSKKRMGILVKMFHDHDKEARGKIICTAYVSDTRLLHASDSRAALINCGNNDRYGLILKDIIAIDPPVPAVGKQGIWIYK